MRSYGKFYKASGLSGDFSHVYFNVIQGATEFIERSFFFFKMLLSLREGRPHTYITKSKTEH